MRHAQRRFFPFSISFFWERVARSTMGFGDFWSDLARRFSFLFFSFFSFLFSMGCVFLVNLPFSPFALLSYSLMSIRFLFCFRLALNTLFLKAPRLCEVINAELGRGFEPRALSIALY
ncbi:hypothetical protein V8C42DRAFT_134102 [Trichoderma barbatum]